MGPIVVHEGDNVRLHCSATGIPTPRITWQRLDNKPINRGAWQGKYVYNFWNRFKDFVKFSPMILRYLRFWFNIKYYKSESSPHGNLSLYS